MIVAAKGHICVLMTWEDGCEGQIYMKKFAERLLIGWKKLIHFLRCLLGPR